MTFGEIAILTFAAGVVLLLAELMLPTHGILGVLGVAALLGGIGMTFAVHPALGAGLLLVTAVTAPLVGRWMLGVWLRGPIGRRLVLKPTPEAATNGAVHVGDVGATVSELRPMGVCEFNGERREAASEYGVIGAGQKVRVVSVSGGRPVVRPLS